MRTFIYSILFHCSVFFATIHAEPIVLQKSLQHLRQPGPREWNTFPVKADADTFTVTFSAKKNNTEHTLHVRQQDVKQNWQIQINGKNLARLIRDENDMIVYFPIAPSMLQDGKNTLTIDTNKGKGPTDDIRVGEISIHPQPMKQVLSEATVTVNVNENNKPIPARITIVNAKGAMQTVGAESNDHLAVRPGTVYTSNGTATFGLPVGDYTIYAGRGFEYSLASLKLSVKAGDNVSRKLTIRREVPTQGYVACDTHVHTLTHSGHGDSTVQERMITLAAEGIELPIATDHNVHIDHTSYAKSMKVNKYFTPVIGNEVTTKVGHFNIFPVRKGAKIPDYKSTDWPTIFDNIYKTPDVKVCILNHGRDLHSGVRPLGPKWHNALVGQNLDGRLLRANAMEVVNSAAIQTDPYQLFRDWMALLNRGYILTPVGSSDSHDVARHFVGQGRTYIRCDDHDPGNISINEAVDNFLQGQVMVSYGLVVQMTVNDKYQSGELVRLSGDKVKIEAKVLGPHWVEADQITLYANGKKVKSVTISKGLRDLPAGVKWQGSWIIDRPEHDVHLVAIASGPGVDGFYWATAKPYQPTSPAWTSRVLGCSGAIWLDGDNNGRRTPAVDYARRVIAASGSNLSKLFAQLKKYDQAIAEQAASLYPGGGQSLYGAKFESGLKDAPTHVRDGFHAYRNAWRMCEIARSKTE